MPDASTHGNEAPEGPDGHVHGCLTCRPEMVPDFSPDDRRYHAFERCGVTLRATVDGVEPGYHKGVFEGPDGWVLLVCEGFDGAQIHECPNCTTYHDEQGMLVHDHYEVCVTPRFGAVEVVHDCPRRLADRAERLRAELEPLVPYRVLYRALHGEELYDEELDGEELDGP